MTQNTLFSSVPDGRSYRFKLTSTIGTNMAVNIADVVITSRENGALVENYVERILRLKKIDLEAGEVNDDADHTVFEC